MQYEDAHCLQPSFRSPCTPFCSPHTNQCRRTQTRDEELHATETIDKSALPRSCAKTSLESMKHLTIVLLSFRPAQWLPSKYKRSHNRIWLLRKDTSTTETLQSTLTRFSAIDESFLCFVLTYLWQELRTLGTHTTTGMETFSTAQKQNETHAVTVAAGS